MATIAFLRDNARFLLAGGLISLSSSYGQTYFIAIFAAQIMAAYGLSDGQWGGVYTLSTVASAAVMLWAGALTDRFRVRALAAIVMPGLAAICIAMALNRTVAGLVVVVFLLRLFGQGMMSQLATVAMARWFLARRGLALSVSALGYATASAAFPVIFASLLLHFDWRSLWLLAAGLVLIAFPVIYRLLAAERTPQSHARESAAVGMLGRQWSRREMLGHPLFWLMLPMFLGPPAWGTALFFQQVHIAEVKGWSLVEYFALLPLLTGVSMVCTVLSGQVIDRFGAGLVAKVYLVPFAIGFVILGQAGVLAGAALAFVFFGIAIGIQSTLPAAFWAEFYGTRHIGSIKAVSASLMVLGSAIGPGISGLLIDLGYSFPQQMLPIGIFFLLTAGLVAGAVTRYQRLLPGAAEIDVERT